jgi:hypothetical protein
VLWGQTLAYTFYALAFLAFLQNILTSLGLKSVLGIFTPSKLDITDPVLAS